MGKGTTIYLKDATRLKEGVLVRYRFDGQPKSTVVHVSYGQYQNLKVLPITIECELVTGAEHILSDEDKEIFKEIVRKASAVSHTKQLTI